jgi:hypothetical protein
MAQGYKCFKIYNSCCLCHKYTSYQEVKGVPIVNVPGIKRHKPIIVGHLGEKKNLNAHEISTITNHTCQKISECAILLQKSQQTKY